MCYFEVTVTSVPLSPFMSHRGLFNTNHRFSHQRPTPLSRCMVARAAALRINPVSRSRLRNGGERLTSFASSPPHCLLWPPLPPPSLCAGSGHEYHSFHAKPLLRSNTTILRLPFELYSLVKTVINIVIASSPIIIRDSLRVESAGRRLILAIALCGSCAGVRHQSRRL